MSRPRDGHWTVTAKQKKDLDVGAGGAPMHKLAQRYLHRVYRPGGVFLNASRRVTLAQSSRLVNNASPTRSRDFCGALAPAAARRYRIDPAGGFLVMPSPPPGSLSWVPGPVRRTFLPIPPLHVHLACPSNCPI